MDFDLVLLLLELFSRLPLELLELFSVDWVSHANKAAAAGTAELDEEQ